VQQAISNLAQSFTPADYWSSRAEIEQRMLQAVAQALLQQGHALNYYYYYYYYY
jgi:hypothetical protein